MQFTDLSWQEFELLCSRVLEAEGFKLISPSGRSRDLGLDILVNPPNLNELWVVECKHQPSFMTSQAREIARQLLASRQLVGASRGLVIVSSDLSPRAVQQFARHDSISVWDRSRLAQLLDQHPDILEEFLTPAQKESMRRIVDEPLAQDPRATELFQQLATVEPGREHFRDYEDACIDILNYAFIPPLRVPHVQSISEDGLDRRDAVYPISIGDPIWDRIQAECRTRMVVAEFKNFSGAPGQKEIESIQQYLYPRAMRSLGLLCAREPGSDAAIRARRRAWLEADKLIVLLCDDDLREILLLKAMGENPSQVIDGQIDEFFVELCP